MHIYIYVIWILRLVLPVGLRFSVKVRRRAGPFEDGSCCGDAARLDRQSSKQTRDGTAMGDMEWEHPDTTCSIMIYIM